MLYLSLSSLVACVGPDSTKMYSHEQSHWVHFYCFLASKLYSISYNIAQVRISKLTQSLERPLQDSLLLYLHRH